LKTKKSAPKSTGSKRRPSGRPRNEALAPAILAAARQLVVRHGYEAVTTQMIAVTAGVGKQTIYRRWAGKADLILDAFIEQAQTQVDLTAGEMAGPVRQELVTFLCKTFAALRHTGRAMRSLMAAAQQDARFCQRFRIRFIERRRATLCSLLTRAIARGELPAHADCQTAVLAIYGGLWYRLLLNEPLDQAYAERLVKLVLHGLHGP